MSEKIETPKFSATETDIHSPFNACQHRGYCQSLLAELSDARAERDAAVRDAPRLEYLMRNLTGRALRECIGDLADTADITEFRTAIDSAIAARKP